MSSPVLERLFPSLALVLVLGGCAVFEVPPVEPVPPPSEVLEQLTPEDEARALRQRQVLDAGIGSLTRSSVGYYMNLHESRMRSALSGSDVGVRREGNRLLLTMPGNLTFQVGRSALDPSFHAVLGKVADVLTYYEKTLVEISGHSDSTGDESFNERLSLKRAESVAQFLTGRGVQPVRIYAQGIGEGSPIASNDSEEGRALNRRVELLLIPVVE